MDASHRINFSIGFAIYRSGNLVCCKSKVIEEESDSSCLSELFALEYGMKNLTFFENIFTEIDFMATQPPLFFTDSSSLIQYLHKNSSTKQASKWKMKFHNIKKIFNASYLISHIAGDLNVADIFTKRLHLERFRSLSSKLLDFEYLAC